MFVVIFGRAGCPYCVRAKNLADKLKQSLPDFDYRYVDIVAEKAFLKRIYPNQLGNPLKPYHKFLLMKNRLVAVQILKP